MGIDLRTLRATTTAALLLLLLPGCATTQMWKAAGSADVRRGGGSGVLIAPGAGPTAVLHYVVDPGNAVTPTQSLYAFVSMGANGAATSPYVYDGPERVPARVLASLSVARLELILTAPPDWRPPAAAEAAFHSPNFHKFGGRPDDEFWSERVELGQYVDGRVEVIAFGPGKTGPRRQGPDDPWPTDCRILIVPAAPVRPAEAIASARGQAALLTPLTLAYDALSVVVAPVVLVLYVAGGLKL